MIYIVGHAFFMLMSEARRPHKCLKVLSQSIWIKGLLSVQQTLNPKLGPKVKGLLTISWIQQRLLRTSHTCDLKSDQYNETTFI